MSTNDTTAAPQALHPSQTLEGAKRAATILQQPPETIAEQDLTTVYLDFGPGVVLAVYTAGCFSMHALEVNGRASIALTAEETRALYRFWLPISGEIIMRRITEAVAERQAEQAAQGDVVELIEERKQARRFTRVIDIAVAPNCEPDTLSYPPRVVTAPDGSQRLQMRNDDGWDTETDYPVLEVTRMDGHGLVLVGIGEQAILMSSKDFDTPAE